MSTSDLLHASAAAVVADQHHHIPSSIYGLDSDVINGHNPGS